MENITHDQLIEAGFYFDKEDPIMPYFADSPFALCLEGALLAISANTPEDAIDWATRIISYEPNF